MKNLTKRTLAKMPVTQLVELVFDLQKQLESSLELKKVAEKASYTASKKATTFSIELEEKLIHETGVSSKLLDENGKLQAYNDILLSDIRTLQGIVTSRLATVYLKGENKRTILTKYHPDGAASYEIIDELPEDYYFLKNLQENIDAIFSSRKEETINFLELDAFREYK